MWNILSDSRRPLVVSGNRMKNRICCVIFLTFLAAISSVAQEPPKTEPQKANSRPVEAPTPQPEPFDGATVEKMAGQCVTLQTELGAIEIEMIPESAPESVRNFLNLAATGALDTTTFSRVVKDFVVQGGNLSTSEKWNADLSRRMSRKLPDEPGIIRHERGIVSMARSDEPNSATTHFFILVGPAPHLNAKFAAFGRVKKGMEVVDAMNNVPLTGEKPDKPVKITQAVVATCAK
jgi:cyclophilin family peptidyl-prolyl cis-trans isomerase